MRRLDEELTAANSQHQMYCSLGSSCTKEQSSDRVGILADRRVTLQSFMIEGIIIQTNDVESKSRSLETDTDVS